MNLDDPLLKILACPIDKGPLALVPGEDALYNPRLRRRYPIEDGVPQLLPSCGEPVDAAEHERLTKLTDSPSSSPSSLPPLVPGCSADPD